MNKGFFFLENINNYVIYNEFINYTVISRKNASHMNIEKNLFFFLKNNFFFFFNYFFICKKIKNYSVNKIRDLLVSAMFGYKFRFRVGGRGFYIYYKNNVIFFKLAFSHAIKNVLDLNFRIQKKKKRKKKFFSFISRDKKKLGEKTKEIRSLRGPNLYSKRAKGITIYGEFVPRGINKIGKF